MNEFTEEQRAAVKRVRDAQGPGCGELTHPRWRDVQTILNLLPSELTNPQPELPTEPGAYHDARGTLTIIDPRGKWHGTYGDTINPDLCPAPFTRLVPERPQITREQVAHIVHLATNGTQVIDDLLALVNGADRD